MESRKRRLEVGERERRFDCCCYDEDIRGKIGEGNRPWVSVLFRLRKRRLLFLDRFGPVD